MILIPPNHVIYGIHLHILLSMAPFHFTAYGYVYVTNKVLESCSASPWVCRPACINTWPSENTVAVCRCEGRVTNTPQITDWHMTHFTLQRWRWRKEKEIFLSFRHSLSLSLSLSLVLNPLPPPTLSLCLSVCLILITAWVSVWLVCAAPLTSDHRQSCNLITTIK